MPTELQEQVAVSFVRDEHRLRYLEPLLWAHEPTAPPRTGNGHRKRIYSKLFERGNHSIEPRLLLVEPSDCPAQIHSNWLAIQLPQTERSSVAEEPWFPVVPELLEVGRARSHAAHAPIQVTVAFLRLARPVLLTFSNLKA